MKVYGLKRGFHPKAFLLHKRNVKLGLIARTRVLKILEKQELGIKGIADLSGLSYRVVVHHLRLLEAEHVVARKSSRKPFVWQLTGVGQRRLINSKEQ